MTSKSVTITLWDFVEPSNYEVSGATDPRAAIASRLLTYMCKWNYQPVYIELVAYQKLKRAFKTNPDVLNSWGMSSPYTKEIAKILKIEKTSFQKFLTKVQDDSWAFDPNRPCSPRAKRRLQWFNNCIVE